MSVSVRIVMFREIAHEAVSQRLPVSFGTMVARTRMHTYAAKVGALSLVQGQIFCRPVPTVAFRFATFASLNVGSPWPRPPWLISSPPPRCHPSNPCTAP